MNEINKYKITKLFKGSIMLNKKIYIPYDNTDGSIPENSIIRNRIIYVEFEENSLNKDNENSIKKSDSANCIKSKENIKEKNKKKKNINCFDKKIKMNNDNHSSDEILDKKK